MAKITKQQLTAALDQLRFTINDSHGAMPGQERANAKARIQHRARELMDILELDLNAHAKKIVLDCESQIDRATSYVLAMG